MEINIQHKDGTLRIIPEQHISHARQVIWIGKNTDEVYNTITLEGCDTFQCSITYNKANDTWLLTDGQLRTLCPRGLKSNRSRACSMCRGCCGYIHTANPDYALRHPSFPTLLNGNTIPPDGVILKDGDTINITPRTHD